MQARRLAVMMMLATLLPGCGGKPADLPVMEQVDLARYTGLWYEIARLPAFFQRGCLRRHRPLHPQQRRHPGRAQPLPAAGRQPGNRGHCHQHG